VHFTSIEYIELKSAPEEKRRGLLLSGRSKRDHPASVFGKKLMPVFDDSTSLAAEFYLEMMITN